MFYHFVQLQNTDVSLANNKKTQMQKSMLQTVIVLLYDKKNIVPVLLASLK